MIRFEGVSKIYSTDFVLKNINWEIKKGEKVGLVGSNGAGTVSYTHLRAHETVLDLVCRLLLEKKKRKRR